MDTVQWLINEALSLGGSFLWNFIRSGFLYGLLGLILGTVTVFMLRKNGYMKRPNKIWSVLSWFQYMFIPIIFMIAFGAFASIRGIQNTMYSWIEASTSEIKEYTDSYIPEIQKIASSLASQSNISESDVKDKILESSGLSGKGMAEKFYVHFNQAIINYALEKLGFDSTPEGLKNFGQSNQMQNLSSASFNGINSYLKVSFVDSYMYGIYITLFILLVPLFLISAFDFFLSFINSKISKKVREGISKVQSSK